MIPETSEFRHWAGTVALPVHGTDMVSHDWSQPGPHLVRAFHGTTHPFQAFSLERSTHQAQFGQVHYFTSCESDAEVNYASQDGPDLINRIEQRIEQLEQEMEDNPVAAGLSENADACEISDRAREQARAEIIGHDSRVLELNLRLNRPFVIDADKKRDHPVFEETASLEDATREVAIDHGLTPVEIEANWEDYEDLVYEAFDIAQGDHHEALSHAFLTASAQLMCACPELPAFDKPLCEVTCNELEQLIKFDDKIALLENDEGEFVSGSFFALVLEHLGYDSIVLLNADRRFSSMNMSPCTTHIHLMASARCQIKSTHNTGAFDPANPDIHA